MRTIAILTGVGLLAVYFLKNKNTQYVYEPPAQVDKPNIDLTPYQLTQNTLYNIIHHGHS